MQHVFIAHNDYGEITHYVEGTEKAKEALRRYFMATYEGMLENAAEPETASMAKSILEKLRAASEVTAIMEVVPPDYWEKDKQVHILEVTDSGWRQIV